MTFGFTATGIAVSGNHAVILGNAVVNDVAVRYRMDVVDAEESGAGADSWSIASATVTPPMAC